MAIETTSNQQIQKNGFDNTNLPDGESKIRLKSVVVIKCIFPAMGNGKVQHNIRTINQALCYQADHYTTYGLKIKKTVMNTCHCNTVTPSHLKTEVQNFRNVLFDK
jgi:hypothetical protein